MADVTITVNSAAVHAMLNRAPGQVNHALRGGMEDATTYLLAIVKRYPAQRSGSLYVRTHTLERSWSRRIEGSGSEIRGVVGSNSSMAPYNRVVMDRERQAKIHRGRWTTVQDILERSTATVRRMFEARLTAEFR